MCGLLGFFGGIAGEDGDDVLLCRMADTLIHRGPDDGGVWCDAEQRVGLGHRRLAIVDLSPAGYQPMVSASGRFVIAFNGEIYNHLELRKALELGAKASWRGHSDTETLLAGIEAWGLEATLKKSIGMFAIALWDTQTRTLILARDRMGEKPLYYGWQGSGNERAFLFGSELKALKAHPAFAADIDRGALCLLMRHKYIPDPYSIYQGIAKLEPGCLLFELVYRVADCDWLTLLGNEWESCDNVGEYTDLLLKSPFGYRLGDGAIIEMMNAYEQSAYDALPSVVTVYRGCYKNNKWGMCWSLDRNVAQKFPTFHRYRQKGQPLLVKAEAKKQDIAAVKLGRDEAEIITYRPKHVSTSFIRE